MSHAFDASEPDSLTDGASEATRAHRAVADDAREVAAEIGFVGTDADWADMHTMSHATDDPTRARLRWLLTLHEAP